MPLLPSREQKEMQPFFDELHENIRGLKKENEQLREIIKNSDSHSAIKFWLQCNIDECNNYIPKIAQRGEYKDCIELEGMVKAYKKVLNKIDK